MKIVRKANDDLISFCNCKRPMATSGQLDCPWCGCGWLFTCVQCRRAFTFGTVVESDQPEETAGRKMARLPAEGALTPDDRETLVACLEWIEFELEVIETGTTVVFLDGAIRPVDGPVAFNGWYASHTFDRLPHAIAKNGDELDRFLGDPGYWRDRRLAENMETNA